MDGRNRIETYLRHCADGASTLEIARDALRLTGPDALLDRVVAGTLAGLAVLERAGRWHLASTLRRPRPQVALSVRSTGYQRGLDQVVEVACVSLCGQKETLWHSQVRPSAPLSEATQAHLGVDGRTLFTAPSLVSLAPALCSQLEGKELLSFGQLPRVAFLVASLQDASGRVLDVELTDVSVGLAAGRWAPRRAPLEAACAALDLPNAVAAKTPLVAEALLLWRLVERMAEWGIALDGEAPPAFDLHQVEITAAALYAIPEKPGIYRFWARDGALLYVGKAKNLGVRVRSYFQLRGDPRRQYVELMAAATQVTWQEQGSELRALLAEHRAIRDELPRYNSQREVGARVHVQAPKCCVVFLETLKPHEVELAFVLDGRFLASISWNLGLEEPDESPLECALEQIFAASAGEQTRALLGTELTQSEPARVPTRDQTRVPTRDLAEATIVNSWLAANRDSGEVLDLEEYVDAKRSIRGIAALGAIRAQLSERNSLNTRG